MVQVAVSILNYNSTQATVSCVQSLLTADGADLLDVFVADNDSAAEEQCKLQQSLAGLPRTHLNINSRNQGFAAGHNDNLRAIFNSCSPDFVWLLNNDCLVGEDTLAALISCAQQQPDVGIWGATLLEPDGRTVQCAGGCFYNSWISSYRQYGRGKKLAQINELETVDYDYIAGASLFFPVGTLQKGLRAVPALSGEGGAGEQQWLNEDFFLYFEESDLAQRLGAGFELGWCRGALIRHAGGASTGAGGSRRTALAEYHSTLSALKFTRLYYPQRFWFVVPARFVAKSLQLLIQGEVRLIGMLIKAYRDFFRLG